jgi:hypothetical protein
MNLPIPPSNLITLEGFVVALVVFFIVLYLTREISDSKQSWIPALVFAIIAEVLVSLIVKGLV